MVLALIFSNYMALSWEHYSKWLFGGSRYFRSGQAHALLLTNPMPTQDAAGPGLKFMGLKYRNEWGGTLLHSASRPFTLVAQCATRRHLEGIRLYAHGKR